MSAPSTAREHIAGFIAACWTGVGLCVCYWLGQTLYDVRYFHRSFADCFVPENPHQLGMRIFASLMLLLVTLILYRPTRRRAGDVDAQTFSDVTFLSRTAMDFIELPLEADIYDFIGERLQVLTGDSVIVINSFEEASDALRVRVVLGAGELLATAVRVLGHQPVGLTFTLTPAARAGITLGVLEKAEGGLYQACFGKINKELCHQIEYLTGVDEIYGVGFARKGGIFGDALIITRKGSPLTNPQLIEAFINQASVALQHRKAQEELHSLSLVDELTGLYNRRGFFTLAEQQLKIANRTHHGMLLLFVDLDRLKWINDTHGHHEGDAAIREAGQLFKRCFRESDIVARLGGDEFVALVVEAGEAPEDLFATRMQQLLNQRNAGNQPYPLSMSIGTVSYDPAAPCTLPELLHRADELMYAQKHHKHAARKH